MLVYTVTHTNNYSVFLSLGSKVKLTYLGLFGRETSLHLYRTSPTHGTPCPVVTLWCKL